MLIVMVFFVLRVHVCVCVIVCMFVVVFKIFATEFFFDE